MGLMRGDIVVDPAVGPAVTVGAAVSPVAVGMLVPLATGASMVGSDTGASIGETAGWATFHATTLPI